VLGLVVLVAVLGLSAAGGLLWRRRNGRLRPAGRSGATQPVDPSTLAGLGIDPSAAPVTLVQFSSAFCQPCRATRRVLDEVSRAVPGVAHREVDAESNLELVRRLDVRRTPTVLVLDAAGGIVRRASGQPRKADVIAALGEAVG
jgi:thiol-disulfide isomerase/thioredoxin